MGSYLEEHFDEVVGFALEFSEAAKAAAGDQLLRKGTRSGIGIGRAAKAISFATWGTLAFVGGSPPLRITRLPRQP